MNPRVKEKQDMKRLAFLIFFLIFSSCDNAVSPDQSGNDNDTLIDTPNDSSDDDQTDDDQTDDDQTDDNTDNSDNSQNDSFDDRNDFSQSLTCSELSTKLPNEVGFNLKSDYKKNNKH